MNRQDSVNTIIDNLTDISRERPKSFIKSLLVSCLPKKFKKYERNQDKAFAEIDKNLDLRKFITRLRVSSMTSIGLLSKSQNTFANSMAQIVLKSSSESSDGAGSDGAVDRKVMEVMDDMENVVEQMTNSNDPIDTRFLHTYHLRKAKL